MQNRNIDPQVTSKKRLPKPRFDVGNERVFHIGRKAYGKIISVLNRNDEEDVRAQGYRYLIEHSGWTWSVPERALRAIAGQK